VVNVNIHVDTRVFQWYNNINTLWRNVNMPDGITPTEEQERDDVWRGLYETYPIDQQVRFNEFDVTEKLSILPFRKVQYDDLFYKEKARYDRMLESVEKIQGIRYDHYKFNYDKELTKYEIEKFYLPKDATLLVAKKKLRKQQWRVDFFKMCADALASQQWQIKSFLETMKQGLT
jgi:hypothetical protein